MACTFLGNEIAPKLLNIDQKNFRMSLTEEVLNFVNSSNICSKPNSQWPRELKWRAISEVYLEFLPTSYTVISEEDAQFCGKTALHHPIFG